jgi:tetratricopeptide (TPR) repeat protein
VIDGALGEVDKGLAAVGFQPTLLRLKADLLMGLGRWDQARALLEDYRRWRPFDDAINQQLATVLITSLEGRLHREPIASLSTDLQQAVELWPTHPRLAYFSGFVALGERRLANDVEHLRTALAREPADPGVQRATAEALKQRGLQLLLEGERMPALRLFKEAQAVQAPDFDEGSMPLLLSEAMKRLFDQGIDRFQAGDSVASAALFEQARELFPDHPDVLFNLGLARLELEQAAVAERLFARVEELQRQSAKDIGMARYYRAVAMSQDGRRAEARLLIEQFLAEHPSSAARPRMERWMQGGSGG